jgi:adenylate cyclase
VRSPLVFRSLLLGLLTAFVGTLTVSIPPLAELETSIGLQWLFTLRGPRAPPLEVAVISIDRSSSRRFDLPNEPRKWPRRYYAELVNRLSQLGVQVICFDIIFEESRVPFEDRMLAEAIRRAGNVILFQYLERDRLLSDRAAADLGIQVDMERLRKPIPVLAGAAASLAPFPLPKVPARVNRVWTFKKESAAMPTLPAVVLQQYALTHWEEWRRLLASALPAEIASPVIRLEFPTDSTKLAQETRRIFLTHPELPLALKPRLAQIQPSSQPVLKALLSLYSGGSSRYLDFYGPPHSVTTVPFHKIFDAPPGGLTDLSGKVVFVGFSEQLQPEQKDGFYTVFSQKDGLDVSGVEIAATAFGNLLESRTISPLSLLYQLIFIAIWGVALATLFMGLPGQMAVPAAGLLAFGWMSVSLVLFASRSLWMPLVTPLLFQLPVALIGALLWRFLSTRRERRKIHEAFEFYLPCRVVDDLVKNLNGIPGQGELVYGVCLATDAEKFTNLSENMAPDRLRALLNCYFQSLFEPVRRHGGTVSDVVGDAMMAIWAGASSTVSMRGRAGRAALEILGAVDEFNRRERETPLPTRIGIHGGQILLGNVGAGDHYEYRPVGDIVNTASRIEGLNKQLGTRLLVSAEVVQGLEEIVTREVGRFRLVGKQKSLTVYELMGLREHVTEATDCLLSEFARGLDRFRRGQWNEAAGIFRNTLVQFPTDGPSRYYLGLCEHYLDHPLPETWNGVVALTAK